MKMKYTLISTALACMLVFAAGCNNMGAENPGNVLEPELNSSPDETEDEELTPPVSNPVGEPYTPAKEINRGGEEYDYDGWDFSGAEADCFMFVDKDWMRELLSDCGRWTDSRNNFAELIFQWQKDLTMPPKEAIWNDFGSIIEKGGDVEYGEFESKYLADAYYCRYKADGFLYIQLYCFYYPEGIELNYDQIINSLSFKMREDSLSAGSTLNEEAFWKVAQSMFVAKGYTQIGEPIPYIPEEDGATTWVGSQGIMPSD